MSNIQNLQTFDPFADASKGADDDVQDGLVHIRIQQRNGRKTLTTVQGLSKDYDLKKIVRACKKVRRETSMEEDVHFMSYCIERNFFFVCVKETCKFQL